MWRGLIHHFREHLPVSDATPVITLHEGNTPLIHAPRLAAAIAPDIELYLKFEVLIRPARSKDRGMTMAVSKAPKPVRRSRSAPRRATPRPVQRHIVP
jgi:threonine synthase